MTEPRRPTPANDDDAQERIEGAPAPRGGGKALPAAGPHAEKRLVDDDKTPGAGTVEEAGEDPSTDATSG